MELINKIYRASYLMIMVLSLIVLGLIGVTIDTSTAWGFFAILLTILLLLAEHKTHRLIESYGQKRNRQGKENGLRDSLNVIARTPFGKDDLLETVDETDIVSVSRGMMYNKIINNHIEERSKSL